jgi:uncharacterized membrane protein (UPF0127 family)
MAVLLLVAGCGGSGATTTSGSTASTPALPSTTLSPPKSPAVTTSTTSRQLDTGEVLGFEVATVRLDGADWLVAVADDSALRARGLMQVVELGDLDGMLFAWPEEVQARFTMMNTLIPLDIAFFDGTGKLIEVLEMVPCEGEPCPGYGIDSAFRWAMEAPAGALAGLSPGARLEP